MSSLRSIVQSRRTSNSLIGIILAIQLWLPVSYYFRDDADDERFAWRMFSAQRLQRCVAYAYERDPAGQWRRLDLRPRLHPAWRSLLARNRGSVIQAFLKHRCGDHQTHQAKVETFCHGPWTEPYRRSYLSNCSHEQQL